MDVFDLRQRLVDDYERYITSFIKIADPRIDLLVQQAIQIGEFRDLPRKEGLIRLREVKALHRPRPRYRESMGAAGKPEEYQRPANKDHLFKG